MVGKGEAGDRVIACYVDNRIVISCVDLELSFQFCTTTIVRITWIIHCVISISIPDWILSQIPVIVECENTFDNNSKFLFLSFSF